MNFQISAEVQPFASISHIRKGSPRAIRPSARAKLVHTSRGGRQLVVFLTQPLLRRLHWCEGGVVTVTWQATAEALQLRIVAAHKGLRLTRFSASTTTCRLVITGDFIASSACAPVREVPFAADGDALMLALPVEWINEAIAIRDHVRKTAIAAAEWGVS